MDWSTACPDWEKRLVGGESIIPPPIYPDEAERALAIFKQLRITDQPGHPTFGECSEQWVFDFVSAIFGAYDGETGKQLIREFYLLISKKNTKSTIAAGIMLTALILCWRDEEEHLILAPTKEVAGNSFNPAAGMIRADNELMELFQIQDHIRTITHRLTKATLKVVAADTDTVSGKKSGRILVDEHWLFGMRANADSMFIEATGGQISREEGWVIYLTTQSDQPPAGVFKEKLDYYRKVRDGKTIDRKSLGVLYEFPDAMVATKAYLKPENYYVTNPNIGRSVSGEWLEDQLIKMQGQGDGKYQKFIAKHLNIEIGLNLRTDRWAGADFWLAAGAINITLDYLLANSEVVVVGIDGGGLDDLLGLTLVGRERGTGRWLTWSHAWAHEIALERRPEIAPALRDFEKQGDLTIVDLPGKDVIGVADIVCRVQLARLLPEENGVGVDAAGITDIVDELISDGRDIEMKQIVAISQGWKLNASIKTTERAVAGGELLHGAQPMMAWCVSNARTEDRGNAISVTKQVSGKAKIDPLMALFNAVSLMALKPKAVESAYNKRGILMF